MRALKAESELSAIKSKLTETKKLHETEVKELKQQLASQQTTAEQSAKVAERLAEADKREAIASLREAHVAELDELRQKIQSLTEEVLKLKSRKKPEIENFLKRMSEIVPDVAKSKLYPAREGGYRCYINIEGEELMDGKKLLLHWKQQGLTLNVTKFYVWLLLIFRQKFCLIVISDLIVYHGKRQKQ